MRKLLLILIPILFISCSGEEEIEEQNWEYNFFVAGHVYGNVDFFTSSVYPPFLENLDSIIPIVDPDWLFLTGDVVANPTEENWETVKAELNSLDVPWMIARGNHDISHYMDNMIQPKKYDAIREYGNLILILNTSHPGWCPDSLQRIFIKENLEDLDSVRNIFVLSHQLWWQKDAPDEYDIDSVYTNSYQGFESEDNFWVKVFNPYFVDIEKPVYFIAGDLGCHELMESYYEDHYKNFHFIASGMGGGIEDNYLHVKTFADGSVEIERIDF